MVHPCSEKKKKQPPTSLFLIKKNNQYIYIYIYTKTKIKNKKQKLSKKNNTLFQQKMEKTKKSKIQHSFFQPGIPPSGIDFHGVLFQSAATNK